ncbi:IS30 family transposase, partial [Escherichia coli]|nr:IS30 family transposase [Escherichia coli]
MRLDDLLLLQLLGDRGSLQVVCCGQLKLASALEFFQYRFSDSFGGILGSKPGTIFTMLRDTGGIKPHEHKRAVAHLTLSEREEIRAGLSAKMSIRAIATALNRSPSTISREVQRNRGRRYYKAVDANNRANRMAKRPK